MQLRGSGRSRSMDSAPQAGSGTGLILAALAGCAFMIAWLAIQKGTWIDEYWSVWKTDPALPFAEAILRRSLPDVGHPPLFDVIHWTLAPVTGASILVRRFVNALFLAVLLVPTFLMMRARFAPNAYRMIVLLAVLASPLVVAKFAEHRAYFANACAMLALILTTREIFLRALTRERLGVPLLGWFVVVAFAATNLDYTNALIALPLLAAAAFFLIPVRASLAAFVGVTAVVCLLVLAVQLWLATQVGFVQPSSQVPLLRGIAALMVVVASGSIVVIPLLPAAVANARLGMAKAGPSVVEARRRFAFVLALAFVASCAALVLVQIVSRALLARHAVPAIPLGASLIVELATIASLSRLALTGLCLFALGSTAAITLVKSRDAGWESFAPVISRTFGACPSTEIVAVDGLLLVDRSATWPYVGMPEAIDASFKGVARKWGFPVTMARSRAAIEVAGRCPTIIWLEHNFSRPQATAREIADAAGVLVDDARLKAAERVDGRTRTLLVIPGR